MANFGFVCLSAVIIVAYMRRLPSVESLGWLLFIALLILCATFTAYRHSLKSRVLRLVGTFLVVLCVSALHGHYLLSQTFDDTLISGKCRLEGTITGIVQHYTVRDMSIQRFTLSVDHAQCENQSIDLKKVNLSLYPIYRTRQNQRLIIPVHDKPLLRAGDWLSATVKIKTPRGTYSHGAFDLKLWALNRAISAIGYVREIHSIQPSVSIVHGIRDKISRYFNSLAISDNAKASLQALVLGNKQQVSEQQWEGLRASGTVHLLVVSGLHIGIAVGLGWWLFVGLRSVLHWLRWPWQLTVVPELGALSLSFAYMLLAGASISTQRAWLMALVLLTANWLGYRLGLWQRWWLALIIVVLWHPLSVLEPGFWLSFLAVASLICLQGVKSSNAKWRLLLSSQIAVWLALMPLLLMFFQHVSFISPLINLFAISYISLLVTLLTPALVISFMGVDEPLHWIAICLDYFWLVIGYLSDYTKQWQWTLSPLQKPVIGLLVAACLTLLIPIRRRLKVLALLAWLMIAFPKYSIDKPISKEFRLTMADVGQGLAVLVETQQRTLLFDTGASFPSGFTYFSSVVQPLLEKYHIKVLDRLVISHTDNDHSGGLKAAQQQLLIRRLDSEISTVKQQPFSACVSGEKWRWGDVDFYYRHAPVQANARRNNRSCILEVATANCSVLIMGDAEKKVELKLLPSKRSSKHQVLIVGHHGSNTSTSQRFLQETSFSDALISSGYKNRYNHPHPNVIQRLKQHEIQIWRTDLQGSIEVKSWNKGCQINEYRGQNLRYWW